jgi:hypothetical protein
MSKEHKADAGSKGGAHKSRALSVQTATSQATTITASYIGPNLIVYNYSGLSGNQPTTYGNTAFLWQNGPFIPWGVTPLASQPVSGNTPSGSVVFTSLAIQNKDYIVGYAVGPNVTNICSWAYIPPGGGVSDAYSFQTTLLVVSVTTDAVILQYAVPDGDNPQANGHWVGVFQGATASYTGTPIAQAQVSSSVSQGQVPITTGLLRGTQYTAAYYTGAKPTMMAATVTFSTSP